MSDERDERSRDERQNLPSGTEVFAYAIAHDLRQPLVASLMALGALQLRADDPEPAADLRLVQSGLQEGLDRIEALLAVARLQPGHLDPETDAVSVLAHSALRRLQLANPIRPVRRPVQPGILLDTDPRFPKVALDNLLSNAFQHGGNGEGLVEIS